MRLKETIGISVSIKNLEHELTYKMDLALKPLALTSAQYSALSMLEAEGPLNNAELARRCYVKAQTMIRITKTLSSRSLIEKSPKTATSGGFVLTQKAIDLVCKAHVKINEIELTMVKGLSKKDIAHLKEELASAEENLRRL